MRHLSVLAASVALLFAAGQARAQQEVIKIGVVGPLTGAFAAGGQSQLGARS